MRNFVPCLRASLMARVALVALASGSVAACSSDSTRFGGDPYENPYQESRAQRAEPQSTGGITPAPTSRVERSALSAPSEIQSRPMKGYESQSGGSYRSSSLEPRPSRVEPTSTGSIGPSRAAVARPMTASTSANWSGQGGTAVTARRGDTAYTLSQRYGVPVDAIMAANGMTSAYAISEGSRVTIPAYSGAPTRAVAAAPAAAPAPARLAPVAAPVVVRPAPALAQTHAPTRTQVAAAPVMAPAKPAAPAPKMQFVQGAQPAGAAKPTAPAKPVAAAQPAVEKPAAEQAYAAKPAKLAPAPASASSADDNVKTAALPSPAAEQSGPAFRWPARGRVISAYGSKTSGQTNDGVNIAVPEGTDVKASDDGVVAYSGSELKGFGNLVLIRHSNGWVTAYAHNSALNVKRGDAVRRGQIIAKSGSTGNVSSPQLHFEVRKGAQTVDPIKHLPDA